MNNDPNKSREPNSMKIRPFRGVDGKYHFTILGFFGELLFRSRKEDGAANYNDAQKAGSAKRLELMRRKNVKK